MIDDGNSHNFRQWRRRLSRIAQAPMTVANARREFERGLIGTWSHENMLTGLRLSFRQDGTGRMDEWGWDHFHLDPTYVSVPEFLWRTVADYTIEITHRGETRVVPYDFNIRKDQYDIQELHVFQTDMTVDESGMAGFWLCPHSLVYRGPETPVSDLFWRFWKKLTNKL